MLKKKRISYNKPCEELECIPTTLTTSKAFKALFALDKQVTRNIRSSHIETRPVDSNGLWCCALIPVILISYSVAYKVSPLYKLVAFLGFGLLCYSILFSLFLYMSTLILYSKLNAGCIVSMLLSTVPIYVYTDFGLGMALMFSVLAVYPYSMLLKLALVQCPRTFTVGEAMIMCQSVVLFIVTGVAIYYTEFVTPELLAKDNEMTFIAIYVYTVLSTVGLIVTALYFLQDEDKNLKVLGIIFAFGAVFALTVLHLCLGKTCLPDFVYYIIGSQVRLHLFTMWSVLVVLTVLVLMYHTEAGDKATTSARKAYHILGALVFLTGILNDVPFMVLASGISAGIIILLEALRLSRIEPISAALQAAFDIYCDEKDCGVLAMTPIYLYFGLACPLALVPWRGSKMELELMSGVLATGIGDTAASWFGHRYGVNYWPGSSRTMEGTAFNVGLQMVAVYFLHLFEWLDAPHWVVRTGVAAAVSALVEAQTQQVDNVVLPLVSLLALQATSFLA